jgi:hypothetical protein
MQNMGTDMSFEQRLARVDLGKVMDKVAEEHSLSAETKARAEDLYRKFLTLHARHPGVAIVPPYIVDLVWHEHITNTRQYMADCDLMFGEYLHHNPSSEDLTAEYESGTVHMFSTEFGLNLYAQALKPEYIRAGGCS